MRSVKYSLESSKRYVSLLARVEDGHGGKRIVLSKIGGWRGELALKFLSLKDEGWGDKAAKTYVALEILRSAKNPQEAARFLRTLDSLSPLELHFWAYKFLGDREKPRKAWRILYG